MGDVVAKVRADAENRRPDSLIGTQGHHGEKTWICPLFQLHVSATVGYNGDPNE